MARPALNRKTRRTVAAVGRKPKLAVVVEPANSTSHTGPVPHKISTRRMEPASLTITDQGMAFAIGTDGLLYGWNAILGGWVLNVMNDHDKQLLAKQVADRLNEKPTHTKSAEAAAADANKEPDVMS